MNWKSVLTLTGILIVVSAHFLGVGIYMGTKADREDVDAQDRRLIALERDNENASRWRVRMENKLDAIDNKLARIAEERR